MTEPRSEQVSVPQASIEAAWDAYVDAGDAVDDAQECVRSAVHAAAPILWREWTRQMAVVRLPAPSEQGTRHATWRSDNVTVEAACLCGSPLVVVDGAERTPAWARERAALYLAAADRAEQLVGREEAAS